MDTGSIILMLFALIVFSFLLFIAWFSHAKKDFLQLKEIITKFFKGAEPKLLPIKIDNMTLRKVYQSIEQADTLEKLFLLQALVGSNYRAVIRVVGDHIQIEGFGENTIEEHDRKSFG